MRTQRTATIASRALGLGFVMIGLTAASIRISELQDERRPIDPAIGQQQPAGDAASRSSWTHLRPCFIELGAGVLFLTLSRPVGRFLARGLAD